MSEKRILIIDDSEIDRELLKNMLFLEYEVETAENGYKGVERVLKGAPKIEGILLDLHMPIMDGFSVLELLKVNGITDIPIVIITAESTEANLFKTYPYKIADFICKPYEPKAVISRLKKAFNQDLR